MRIHMSGILNNIKVFQQTSLLPVLIINAHKIIQIFMNQ